MPRARLLLVLLAVSALLPAATRETEWKQVADATGKDQPQTVLGLLKPIETAAFAEQAWGEGTKALAMRVAIAGKLKGGLQFSVKQLAIEIPAAPAAARPLLRLLQALWLASYYRDHGWDLDRRSSIGPSAGDDIETWDASRLRTEIDRRFQDSLADRAALQKIPVAEFGDLLEKGDLGDEFRPTLYDFIAHAALEFYTTEDSYAAQPCDAFEIDAASAILDPSDAFLAWHPESPDLASRNFRALRLYQDLLTFHRADRDPSAFLHCDLERIQWAGRAAVGPNNAVRLDAALRAFIATNEKNPVSADARLDLAGALIEKKRTQEAHALAKAGADAFPEHPFGKLCNNIVNDLEQKRFEVLTPDHWTGSVEQITVNHANIAHIWFRAYRQKWQIDKSTLDLFGTPIDCKGGLDEAITALLGTTPVKSWDAPLRDDHDFAPRATSLAAPADLPPGNYVIVVSGDAGFSLKDNCLSAVNEHVTTHALVVREENGKLAGFVTDAVSGAPHAGVEVHYYYDPEHDRGIAADSTTSNADGWFCFPRFTEDPKHLMVVAGTGDDIAILRTYLFFGGRPNDDFGKPPDEIVFFTDRAIYRPGQTISFKGIWCHADWKKSDYRTVAERKTSVIFRDANHKQLQQVDVVTNEYGSFSGTFTAPAGGLNGECSISAGDLGSVGFRVEEYKRPKFSAAIQAPAASVALGAQVSISGSASSFTGAPIDGATVKWRVTRDSRWPEWMRWSGFTPDIGTREIATGSATTAADGAFTIKFPAVPDRAIDPATDPEFTYQIVADATDPSGETCQTETSISVAYTTLKAEVSAVALLLANQPAAFHIRTASHDGDGCPAEGVLRIFKLIEPAVCSRGRACEKIFADCDAETFPPGNSADPARWATGERVAELPVKTSPDDHADLRRGEANVSTPLEAGAYRAVFVTADANGRQVQELCNLQVVDPSSARFPTRIPFFTACNSDKIAPGQAFTLVWGSGHPSARACVEWYKDGTLLKREWSAPDRTQQVFSLTPDESMRGGFTVSVTQTTLNCPQFVMKSIKVPWTNKDLGLRWEHLTSKLQPGAKDTWTAVITGPDGAAAAVEMAATLYDASLDSFRRHQAPDLADLLRCEIERFYEDESELEYGDFLNYEDWESAEAFDLEYPYRRFQCAAVLLAHDEGRHRSETQASFLVGIRPQLPQQNNSGGAVDPFGSSADSDSDSGDSSLNKPNRAPKPDVSQVTARKNLQETAFFYPHLTSNDKGEIRITFTMPEALTKWRFLGFAHDKNMRSGTLEGETVTAKDLMVQPNPPRFLREGDALDFTVKIINQSEREQSGIARLTLSDAATQKDATAALGISAPDQPWTIPAKQSRTLSWRLTVPDGSGFLTYKALATSGTLSDGEEGWLPVIPRRILLTESTALPVRDACTKDFTIPKLLDSGKSTTLENRFVQVQVVSQPAWYAVMALPYLMEFPHECAEQTFNRYYANALARHIATSNPKIRRIFELWKNTPALESPLAKNTDLKGILLEETPWLNEANDQSQARHNLGLLLDDNHLGEQLDLSLRRLREMQCSSGLWPWFAGGPNDKYISLYIATGFARLRAFGVPTDITPALKALPQLDADLTKSLTYIKNEARKDPKILAANHLDAWIAHHLYTRTFFLKDCEVKRADKEAFDYFAAQAKQYWASLGSRMSRAHVALALARLGDHESARLITRSLRENAVTNEETGMSWKDAEGESGWYWWQAPIETQAMMIEAFREIDHDAKAVEDCQVWLIKQMQVRDWRTTKATADAIHALLMGGRDLLGSDTLLQVSLGGAPVKPEAVEPGTGFYEARFAGSSIKPEMGAIRLTKTDPGVAWASIHWQYLEDLAKITEHNATPLKLDKSLYVRKNTVEGPKLEPVSGPVKVGDELVTRLVLRNDRAMEFVHLKDLRGSGTEPLNVLSGYRQQDGFAYYEVTRDTASHYFFDTLPAGTHVFETSVRVQHAGIYQTGAAEIRCMYAPEFSAHSASIRLEVVR